MAYKWDLKFYQHKRSVKILIQTHTDDVELCNRRKEKFKMYRTNLRKSIRNAKRTYFEPTFKMILKKFGKY